MKESGILKEVDRGRYQYNHVVTSLTGTFVRRSNGRNSFLPDDGSEAIAIAERDSAHAMDGDKVRVQLFARRKNQEPEGEVVEILESKERVFVGKLQVQNGLSFLITEDRTLANDIFIPRDTSGVTSYFSSIVNSGVLYMYALEYSDRHKAQFAAYENYEELWAYLKTQPLVNDFANYAMRKGIKKRPALIAVSRQLIETQLQAYIIRNFFKDAGFYPVFQQDDVTLKKAVEVLTDGKPLMEHI